MAEKKRRYTKGMELVHRETGKKILFGSFNDDDEASCLDSSKMFVNIPRAELEADYVSMSQLHKESREKRSGQAW